MFAGTHHVILLIDWCSRELLFHCLILLFQGMERGGPNAPPVELGEGEQEEADQGRFPPGVEA